jgi:hypothetical protein
MKQFESILIGKLDSNGIELRNNDKIIIEVCKPDGFNRSGVYHEGKIVYENTAFCILNNKLRITPLTNYSYNCKVTKTN